MVSDSRPLMDENRCLIPLEPGEQATVDKMYFTQCPVCGPVNDWSQTLGDARRAAAAHARAHARRAYCPLPLN